MTASYQVAEASGQYLVEAAGQVVPVGYKRTEVGVIPEDWEYSSLNEVSSFGGGTTPARNQFERYYSSGIHPWVKTLDLNNGAITETEEYVTNAALAETSLKKHKAGSVLVAMYGGFNQIGRTGLLKIDAAINQALVAIIPDIQKLNSEYLLFNLNFHVDYWKGVASSSRKDPNITSNDVKGFVLPLPSVNEQTAIANALSDVDALINELEKLITKKQAIKTATLQQLLTGRTRLPPFALREDGTQKGYKQSELGEIPEDWDTPTIRELSKNIIDYRGRTPKKLGMEWGGNIPALSAGNVRNGFIDFEADSYFGSADLYKRWMTSGDPKQGDIVFTMEAPLGNAALIPDDRKYILSQRVILIQTDSLKFESKFVIQVFMSKVFQAYISDCATGSTAQGIKRTTFECLRIALPTELSEQTAIATILSDMDTEIQTLHQRLSKTRQIKQGMMQELLTGKIRLLKPAAQETQNAEN